MAQAGAIKGKALCNLHKAHTAEALAKEHGEVADQLSWLLGRRYSRTKKAVGAPTGNTNADKNKVCKLPTLKSAEALAKEHGEVADQLSWLRGRRYSRTKKDEHDGGKGGTRSGVQIAHHLKTAESLAKEHGVNESTIRRRGKESFNSWDSPRLMSLSPFY